MAPVLGSFAKWAMIIVIFGFSITLSFTFFASIAPPDKPWFTYAALGLTEGGFILWLVVFMLAKHSMVHKSIALVMSCACGLSSLAVAGYEFYVLLADKYQIASTHWLIQSISILLEVIFAMHLSALVIDLFASYFAVYPFRVNKSIDSSERANVNTLADTKTKLLTGQSPSIKNGSRRPGP